jgi:CysZ protein
MLPQTYTHPVKVEPLRFSDGVRSMPRAFAFLLAAPRLWPFALVPAVVLFALTLVSAAISMTWVRRLVLSWLPDSSEWYGQLLTGTVPWLAALLSAVLGIFFAVALTPVISSPALEKLVMAQEQTLLVPARPSVGILNEFWCGLRAQITGFAIATPLLLGLWLLGLFLPALGLFLFPIKLFLLALTLAWNLFDYPLTLWGVSVRHRLALLRRHTRPVLGFGVAFALLFWIPCCSILLLPVGVIAATGLVWSLLARDRELLPELPRAGGA